MAYKFLKAAQHRWRRLNGHELVALVRAGAPFIDGQLRERNETEEGTSLGKYAPLMNSEDHVHSI